MGLANADRLHEAQVCGRACNAMAWLFTVPYSGRRSLASA